MQFCTTCVLTSRYPGVNFDEQGVCNYCRSYKKIDGQLEVKQKCEAKFLNYIDKYKGRSVYDCLVAYSGGKDSTYTLYLMKKKYNLNVLAVTLNNWYQSKWASSNIQNVIKSLNIDHFTVTPNFENFNILIASSIVDNLYSMKTVERASTICTTCLAIIRFICFKISIEKEIPFTVLGLSPGQAPVATAIFKTNPKMVKRMQDAIMIPLEKYVGDRIKPYFLEERHFDKVDSFPFSVNPLAFSNYDEETIYKISNELGWERPSDTDPNSTNCLLNSYANHVHIEKYGYHPYSFEVSELVRQGCLTREEGLSRLTDVNKENILMT